ncbi:g5938 [Coccomyxa viridis]|uniref:G5938 protein n=1 Tax=Coccomyxa viridis TaxID=1274662 RepID=A0ABP1FWG6_9CHLO
MVPAVKLKRAGGGTRKVLPASKKGLGLSWPAKYLGWVLGLICLLAAWQLAQRRETSEHPASQMGPTNRVYPVGCKWRDVQPEGRQHGFWDIVKYEYWSQAAQQWVAKMPEACMVRGEDSTRKWSTKYRGPARTEVNCSDTHCIYDNLWYTNGRFYLLVDGPDPVKGWDMTRNQKLHVLHMDSAQAFAEGQALQYVQGDTLLFDFVYFLHPTAIGHWGETMFPLFSILKREASFAWPPAQFVLLHLKRVHLMEWVRAVVATTLGVAPRGDLPPILMQQEVPSIWDQIPSPLEGFGNTTWVCFQRALVVRDIFTGGKRTFFSSQDAQDFRARIYARNGLAPPQKRAPLPRQITFQRKRANRRVVNEDQLISLLKEFGQVRVVEFNASTPFEEQLEVMASTAVFVSVHTSNLANAQFLQPGSAVVELIQRNWIWHNLDKSFQVQTEVMGDIHHYAWRARFRNQTVYIDKRDGERFADWTSQQCATEDCVEAHTNVDVVVNVAELRALLVSCLPRVFEGASVESASLPWPPTD